MRADRSATSGAGLFISGLSLGAAGSDVLPGSSGVDAREVDVGVDAADDCAQHDENQQNDQSDKHGVVSVRRNTSSSRTDQNCRETRRQLDELCLSTSVGFRLYGPWRAGRNGASLPLPTKQQNNGNYIIIM